MPMFHVPTQYRRLSASGYGHSRLRPIRVQPAGRASTWPAFVAGLWFEHRNRDARCSAWCTSARLGFGMALLALAGCSELAGSSDVMPPPAEPPYVSLAANYFQAALKGQAAE